MSVALGEMNIRRHTGSEVGKLVFIIGSRSNQDYEENIIKALLQSGFKIARTDITGYFIDEKHKWQSDFEPKHLVSRSIMEYLKRVF